MVTSFKQRRYFVLFNRLVKVVFFISLYCLASLPVFAQNSFFNPDPLLKQASLALEQGNFLEALDDYELVYSYSKDRDIRARALVRQGDIYALFLERKQEAKQLYRQAIYEFPKSLELKNAYFNLAMLSYEDFDLENAEKHFKLFIQLFPQDIRVYTAKYMLERIDREKKEQLPEEKKSSVPALVAQQQEPVIRVLLAKEKKFYLDFKQEIQLFQGKLARGRHVFEFKNHALWVDGNKESKVFSTKGLGGFVWQGKEYAGEIKVLAKEGKLWLINVLPLETYLEGVVSKEMSPSWPLAALQSQAVAARTYAYYLYLKSEDRDYDLSSTTASQVYGGKSKNNQVEKAVKSTRGEILTYENKPILAYFHAHSGGMLEKSSNVWKVDFPYFLIKKDPFSPEIKREEWQLKIQKENIERVLRSKGFALGSIQEIQVGDISPSGRIINLKIVASKAKVVLASNSFRLWLGPRQIKSTLAEIKWQGDGLWIRGRGYGHGVGLSQWGAYALAKEGKSYRDILAFYYPQTRLKVVY